jgi:uncharacterized protein YdiU (UPF0061 family)
METPTRLALQHSYARLPERMHVRLAPSPVAAPRLIQVNTALAGELGLDAAWLASEEGVAMLAGNSEPAGVELRAMAYAGHQFGQFVPSLGDGRAALLGEVVRPDGARFDLQLKGSGPTPFSRRGDGRAALGPVLREYLVAEAMHALGIPTTRALAAVATGEFVFREDALPGAVLARVAASHIRVGTFQYFAARRDKEALRALADHAIARHDPAAADAPHPYRALYGGVVARQASLVARWMLVGFIHGVMNTDNCTISGETIDYGPCAFMDAFDPAAVFSSIDHAGRYAYNQQPHIAHWNLARLAEAMLPILADNEDAALEWARQAIAAFAPAFEAAYHGGLLRKLGIVAAREGDLALAHDLLGLMAEHGLDFTNTFRGLLRADADQPPELADWLPRWRARIAEEDAPMETLRAANPAVIPRNHLVEAAIAAAVTAGDFGPFEALLAAGARPYEDAAEPFTRPPEASERVTATFCGT